MVWRGVEFSLYSFRQTVDWELASDWSKIEAGRRPGSAGSAINPTVT